MNKIGQKFIVCCLSYFDAIVFISEDILDRTYISYMPKVKIPNNMNFVRLLSVVNIS